MKIRTEKELQHIFESWAMQDGILVWKRNANGRKCIGNPNRIVTGKWSAQIWLNNRCIHLGTFSSEEEAVEIRELATEMLHGSFANTKSYKKGNL